MSSITAVAMDNEGASTTSGTVTVSGQATSGATELYVNSIATGTQGAGQGKKFGTALIEVLDNNGTPVAGAEVYGTFSGTFNESSSGITDANGTASLITTSTAKGSVTVKICVDGISHSSLTYNSTLNQITCTDPSARNLKETLVQPNLLGNEDVPVISIFPNPFDNKITIGMNSKNEDGLTIRIYSMEGRLIWYSPNIVINQGQNNLEIPLVRLQSGIYMLETIFGGRSDISKIIKR